MNSSPCGKVQRLVLTDGEMPRVETRTRDLGALLAEAEWGWTADAAEGYVFDSFAAAERHAEALRTPDEHVFAVVAGSRQLDAERLRRRLDAELRARLSVSPQEAYAELERRHLD